MQAHGATRPRFAFIDQALDRADALRDAPDTLRALWPQAQLLVLDDAGHALTDPDERPWCPDAGLRGAWSDAFPFLGMAGDRAWFACPASAMSATAAASRTCIDLRSAADRWPALAATAFAQARAVLHWHAQHRHCPRCGGRLVFRRAGWEGWCAACVQVHYPRTDPAVIMAVSDGERLLLGRQHGWPPRRWSVLAGFVEPGESLEQAVAREVLEESGVRVLVSRYLASQPWPFPGSLMLGFIATAHPDMPRASAEMEQVQWFAHADVGRMLAGDTSLDVRLSPAMSISRWLIQCWHDQTALPAAG